MPPFARSYTTAPVPTSSPPRISPRSPRVTSVGALPPVTSTVPAWKRQLQQRKQEREKRAIRQSAPAATKKKIPPPRPAKPSWVRASAPVPGGGRGGGGGGGSAAGIGGGGIFVAILT